MLVEFRVKNFRSLRDEQVLSMVASKDKSLQETHTHATGISAIPALLHSAVIYGANASGKSNLIKALQYMRLVVVESARSIEPGRIFTIQPFRLDADSSNQPSAFELTLLIDGVRYQYGFSMTAQRIVSEHLLVYKAFKPQRWFTRHLDDATGKDVYEFGSGLKGPKNLWEGATRPNSLFLSMAVQLNSVALGPLFDWIVHKLVIHNENIQLNKDVSAFMLMQPDSRNEIRAFLTSADISISDIEVETHPSNDRAPTASDTNGGIATQPNSVTEIKVRFHHVTKEGKAVFELMDESSGTRTLLFLAGPVLKILESGATLVMDELDTSLHTLLVRKLIRLFHRLDTNTNGAQLIFTTHDTSLLDAPDLFRRDQIWFVEKGRDQSSSLVGLSEFSPRKNEALERGYLMGRYGGVPFLDETLGQTS